MKGRYLIIRGEQGIEITSTSSLEKAKKIVNELDQELTSVEYDNLENHWILDIETEEEICI